MKWAIGKGKLVQVTDADLNAQCYDLVHTGAVHQLKLLIQNWTDGDADTVVAYNVLNGLDAWRKLYHNELPNVDHQIRQLTDEFTALKKK